jgi:hypothetical protein
VEEVVAPRPTSRLSFFSQLLSALLYLPLAYLATKAFRQTRAPALLVTDVAVGVHFVDCLLQAYGVARVWPRLRELLLCAVNPTLVYVSFHFAARFEIDNGFFQLRVEAVHAIVGFLVVVGVLRELVRPCCENKDDVVERLVNQDTGFSFISEVVAVLLMLALSMLVWAKHRFPMLLISTLSMTLQLGYGSAVVELARVLFFFGVLATEHALNAGPLFLS